MIKLPTGFRSLDKLSASGANASSRNAWTVWKIFPVPGVRPFFPPHLVMQVKALACELPHQHGLPLSRYSGRDLVREVARRGLVASISGRTIWRWLDQDAIPPWQHRSSRPSPFWTSISRGVEGPIVGHHDPLASGGVIPDFQIGCFVHLQTENVAGLVSALTQKPAKGLRKLVVHQEIHAPVSTT